MSNNSYATMMKTRSEELNRKMADINWWVSTMKGILKSACKGIGATAAGKTPPTFRQVISTEGTLIETKVTMYHNDDPCLLIINNGLSLDEEKHWNPRRIDLVHAEFDRVIFACEFFCRQVGREEQYKALMSRFIA
jgi:hypothetical protein